VWACRYLMSTCSHLWLAAFVFGFDKYLADDAEPEIGYHSEIFERCDTGRRFA